jgi:hypothetical protein
VIKTYSQECGALWCLWATISTLRIINGRHYLNNRLANLRKNSKTYQCITVPSFNLAKSYYILKHAILSIVPCIILYCIISYIISYIILYYIILYYIHQSYCTEGKCTYVTYNAINTVYGTGVCVLGAIKLFCQFQQKKKIENSIKRLFFVLFFLFLLKPQLVVLWKRYL